MNDLTFSRFLQLRDLLQLVKQEEAKEKYILAAFVGWQMGAGGKKNFGEYLRHLGLSDETSQQVGSQKREDVALLQKREDATLSRMGIKAKRVKK